MVKRDALIKAVSDYLDTAAAPEYNGLQVQGKETISRAVFGVSANMALFKKAAAKKADIIFVHHGLLWGKQQALTGVFGRRVAFLIKNDINLAGFHLPLDKHPICGNNAQLAKLLGLKDTKPFGNYHGMDIGFIGQLPKKEKFTDICKKLGGEFLPYGKKEVRNIALVSGGAHDMLEQAIAQNADLYITGSRDEYVTETCREAQINFIAMGHYNSERLGIKALMDYVASNFDVETSFIEVQNPF